MDTVADKLNIPNLAVRVLFASWHPGAAAGHQSYEVEHPVYRHSQGDLELRLMRQSYVNTITPLERLRGLKSFFVYLKDPWWHSKEYNYYPRDSDSGHDLFLQKLARLRENMIDSSVKLEKKVMGEQYDSAAVGRPSRDQSPWNWDYKRYWCAL